MKYFPYCLLIIAFFLFTKSFSQSYSFKNYNVEDGLASSTVYHILQDKKGFIWFATENGISRFDGNNFRTYTTADGLTDNTVLKIFEDSKNRFWCITLSGKICYLSGDKFYSPRLDDILQNTIVRSVFEDKEHYIWLVTSSKGLIRIDEKKSANDSFEQLNIGNNHILNIDNDSLGRIWMVADSVYLIRQENEKAFQQPISVLKNTDTSAGRIWALKGGEAIYGSHNKFILIDSNLQQYPITNFSDFSGRGINSYYQDNNDNLWFATNKGTVFLGDDFIQHPQKNIFLDGKNVTRVLRDIEGNYWFSTIGEGIYFLSNKDIATYTIQDGLSDNKINCIGNDKTGNIWLGMNNGKVNSFSKNKFIEFDAIIKQGTSNRVTCFLSHTDGSVWFGKDDGLMIINVNGDKIKKAGADFSAIKSLCQGVDDNIFWGTCCGLFQADKNNLNISIKLSDKRTTAVYVDNNGILWLGNNDGLRSYDPANDGAGGKQFTYYGDKNNLLSQRITYIHQSKDSTLWLATNGNGLVAIKDSSIFNFSTHNGFPSNVCNSFFIDEKNIVWAATNKGLSRIELINNDFRASLKTTLLSLSLRGEGEEKHPFLEMPFSNFKIFNYTTNHGLASDEVNGVTKQGNKIYAATNKGLTVFEEDKIIPTALPPPIYISRVRIMDIDTAIHEQYDLAYNHNNIKIDFIGLSYKSIGKIRYRYKISNEDTGWTYTSNPSVQYPKLPADNYTFQVSAMNIDGYWSEKPATIQFIIHPPFWEMWLFRVFAAVTFVGITIGIANWRIRQKTELVKKIAGLELNALRAQMNPHFIFNALNSIQQFISDNDKKLANKYLTDFARLTRMIMEHSKNKTILITEELEALKLYLELEALQFENKFDYHFEIDKAIDIYNEEIPPLIIQPFVENAIHHGIAGLDRKGEIKISMKKEDKYILCKVIDNGIGREMAEKIKSEQQLVHKSRGMSVTAERLKLLNSLYQNNKNIEVLDITDEQNNITGTEVRIYLPIE